MVGGKPLLAVEAGFGSGRKKTNRNHPSTYLHAIKKEHSNQNLIEGLHKCRRIVQVTLHIYIYATRRNIKLIDEEEFQEPKPKRKQYPKQVKISRQAKHGCLSVLVLVVPPTFPAPFTSLPLLVGIDAS
jgi:hypothetical protein